jgi:hypothetical protein
LGAEFAALGSSVRTANRALEIGDYYSYARRSTSRLDRSRLPAYANTFDDVGDAARNAAQKYPAITASTNRSGLRAAMGNPPEGMKNPQAQHDLPWTFRDWFAAEGRGLNVNDPAHGRWVEGTPPGEHQRWSYEFEQEWHTYIRDYPYATRNQVLNHMNVLRNDSRFQ